MQAVQAREAEATLKGMLAEAGASLDRPSVDEAWPVWRRFAEIDAEDVAPDDDGLLFEWGTYAFNDGQFMFGLTRQFSFYRSTKYGGEYDHMEQLHCMLFFEPTDELRALGSGEMDWWFRWEGDLDAWLDKIEEHPAHSAARRAGIPLRVRLAQEEV